jgi:DNA-binding winged helix-turn-helix (wHTH) protein/Tfp pilus assembly protein PilF/TolB-like protein
MTLLFPSKLFILLSIQEKMVRLKPPASEQIDAVYSKNRVSKYRKFAFAAFTFDSETGSLLRNARQLRIPHQTAKLLEFLLSRAGTLVTREELQQVLWPDGEFLEYEQGINKAINRLREILRDDPKQPRFLETIPKRGYRFVAKVTISAESDSLPAPATSTAEEAAMAPEASLLPPLRKEVTEQPEPPLPIWPIGEVQFERIHPELPRAEKSRPLHLYAWVVAGIALIAATGVRLAMHTKRPSQHPNVAVGILPFQAEGPEGSALAESFRLHVDAALSQLPGVQVRSPHSMADRRGDADIQSLAKDSGLDMLLIGSLVQSGDQYLLQVELVRAGDASHLASFQYSGSRDEQTSISTRIQRDFFGYLNSGSETAQAPNGSTQNRAAYGYYLQGKSYSTEPVPEAQARAIESYQAALGLDPNFALAYAGMAHAYLGMYEFSDAPNKSLDKAKEVASEALRKNPALAEAHAVLGFATFLRDWDAAVGEKEIRVAIQLDTGQPMYHNLLSVVLSDQGRFDESLHEIDLAHAADPAWDGAYETEAYLAGNAHRKERAIHAAQKSVNLSPNWARAHDDLAWTLFAAGQYPQAIAEWRLMAVLEKDEQRTRLEDTGLAAFRRGGIRAYAKVRLAASLVAEKGNPHRNDFVLAEWYTCAGENDKAIAALQDVVTRHDPLSLELAVDPMYDNLHHDPRYLALLTQIGLSLPAHS